MGSDRSRLYARGGRLGGVLYWQELHAITRDLIASASRSVLVVSPFVKRAALGHLLAPLPSGVELVAYTRWRAEEVARGVSDLGVLGDIEALGGELGLVDELHAKLVLVDDTRALVGSANVTAAGLGLSAKPNFELMSRIELDPASALLLRAELRSRSRRATLVEAKAMQLVVDALPPYQPECDPEALEPDLEQINTPSLPWVPQFRSPDRLFTLYRDAEWLSSARSNDPALVDLLNLRLPPALSRVAFDEFVRARLLNTRAVQALEAGLCQPQRFGALTEMLRTVLPETTHSQRQAALQVLLRWLIYFAGDRFRMDTPNYSEIVSLR